MIGEAFVAVKPDTKGFGADAEKGVLGSVTSVAKKAAAILGGAFVAQKGIAFLKDSVAAARESNAIAAQTAAVIKSTGGAAGVTAKQVDQLSNSIARKTGIDDEQIAKASNLLLTFTNVRNEVGKGNDVFNRATSLAADMGKAFGTDAAGSAIQLGKALNDPTKGITALTRVGVSFTDQQKKQIETLQKSGDTLGAQKIILGELTKEFGGSAAAQATASDKLKVALGNVQEQIGNKLIPIIDRAATFLADKLPGALDSLGGAFSRIRTFLTPVIALFKAAFAGFAVQADDIDGFQGTVARAAISIGSAFRSISAALQPVFEFIGNNIKPILIGLGAALLVLTSPITAVIASLVLLYAKFEIVRDVVNGVLGFIGDFVTGFTQRFGAIVEAATHIINALKLAIDVALAPILLAWQLFGDSITAYVQGAFNALVIVVQTAVRIVRDVIDVTLAIINGDWGKAWDAFKDIPAAAFSAIIALVRNSVSTVLGIVKGLGSSIASVSSGMFDGIKNAFKSAINAIIRWWNNLHFQAPKVHIPGTNVDVGGFTIDTPNIPSLARGGIATARRGGVLANIAEAGRDEVVAPLPPGFVEAMEKIARGDLTAGGGPLIGELQFIGATVEAAESNASALVRRLKTEAWVQGR